MARGEKVGLLKVRLFRPFPSRRFLDALPATVQSHRRARSHEGAGRDRRAALPRRRHGAQRSRSARSRGRASSAAATACPRKNSRLRWSRACSTSWRSRSRRITSRSASTTMSRTQPRLRSGLFHRRPRRRFAACSTGSAPTERSGANKNSIKIIGEETDNLRAGLLRVRLEEVRLHDDLASALRPEADPLAAT